MVLLIKWVPWSLIIILGHPNLVITFLNKKCVIVSALQSLTGLASSHLFKYSVLVMIYLDSSLIFGGLIGSKKSISHLSNTCRVTYGLRRISSLLLGFPNLR
jgi:hypothetical protein